MPAAWSRPLEPSDRRRVRRVDGARAFAARFTVGLLSLITASCASRYAIVRENGRVVEQSWRDVTYAWGNVDSADADPCSFASNVTSAYGIEARIRGDEFVLSVPQTRHPRLADGRLTWFTYAPSERAIPANTIVRLAYQRTTRTAPRSAAFDVASAAIGLLVDAIRPNRIDRHFLSVDFRDASGGVASATV